jgi:hypothetical protein
LLEHRPKKSAERRANQFRRCLQVYFTHCRDELSIPSQPVGLIWPVQASKDMAQSKTPVWRTWALLETLRKTCLRKALFGTRIFDQTV